MELQGTHQFNAPLPAVWAALMDPAVLAQALPGGDQMEQIGENDYKAAMNVRVGPVQGRFEGKVTLSDILPMQRYTMQVSGQGAPGHLSGAGTLHLAPNDAGTLMTYQGEVQVGGRIASLGQRLIESTAKSMIRQGLKALDDQLVQRAQPAPAPSALPPTAPTPVPTGDAATPVAAPTAAPTPAPTPTPTAPPASPAMGKIAAEVARDVAQDLAADYIPRNKQPQVFAFILGALSMLLFVVLVRLVQRD